MSGALFSGGCRCGEIRYEISSEPLDVIHCHCGTCRWSATAPYLTWMALPVDAWVLNQGELRTFRSSDKGERSFCPTCGCQVLFQFDGVDDQVFVTAGSLDDPEAVVPNSHTFVGDSVR